MLGMKTHRVCVVEREKLRYNNYHSSTQGQVQRAAGQLIYLGEGGGWCMQGGF